MNSHPPPYQSSILHLIPTTILVKPQILQNLTNRTTQHILRHTPHNRIQQLPPIIHLYRRNRIHPRRLRHLGQIIRTHLDDVDFGYELFDYFFDDWVGEAAGSAPWCVVDYEYWFVGCGCVVAVIVVVGGGGIVLIVVVWFTIS